MVRIGELLAGMHELLAQGKMDEILSTYIDACVSRTAKDREDLFLLTVLRDCPFEHKTLHPVFRLIELEWRWPMHTRDQMSSAIWVCENCRVFEHAQMFVR